MINAVVKISRGMDGRGDLKFLPYSPGVYFSHVTRPYNGYSPYYSLWKDDYPYRDRTIISEVRIDGEYYNVKEGESSEEGIRKCQEDDKSFFFDVGNQVLYINMGYDSTPWYQDDLLSGMAFQTYDTFSNQYHEEEHVKVYPRLMKSGVIEEKAYLRGGSPQFFDKTFSLDNGDGALDSVITEDTFGKKATFYIYQDSEIEVSSGIVDEINYSRNKIDIKCRDFRRRENFKFPVKTFGDDTTFGDNDRFKPDDNLMEDLKSKVIPEVLGRVSKVTPVLIGQTSSVWKFRVAQRLSYVGLVELLANDESPYRTLAIMNTDYDNGYFEISKSRNNLTDKDRLSDIRVSLNNDIYLDPNNPAPSMINTAPIVFKYLLGKYNSINFDDDNFDVESFKGRKEAEGIEERLLLNTVGFYVDERTEFYDFVKMAQESTLVDFSYTQDDRGRRSIVIAPRPHFMDFSSAGLSSSTHEFYHTDLVTGEIKMRSNLKNVVGEIVIRYIRDQSENEYRFTYTKEVKGNLLDRVLKNNKLEIDASTGSMSEFAPGVDIHSYAINSVLPYVSNPGSEFEIVLPIDSLDKIKHKLYDLVIVHTKNEFVDPQREQYGGVLAGEIIRRKTDLDKLEYTLTLRKLVSQIDKRPPTSFYVGSGMVGQMQVTRIKP